MLFDTEVEKDFPERVSSFRDWQNWKPPDRRHRPCYDIDKARNPFKDHICNFGTCDQGRIDSSICKSFLSGLPSVELSELRYVSSEVPVGNASTLLSLLLLVSSFVSKNALGLTLRRCGDFGGLSGYVARYEL
jgi:hypothetical protein